MNMHAFTTFKKAKIIIISMMCLFSRPSVVRCKPAALTSDERRQAIQLKIQNTKFDQLASYSSC
jgi:hypothetical protein